MSLPMFMLRCLWITPQVMLRFVPALLLYIGFIAAIFLGTQNIWVVGILLFIMCTFGYAALLVQGIRAALQALRLTDAPTAEGLGKATTRMVFVFGLLQLLLLVFFSVLLALVFFYVVGPMVDPAAVEALRAAMSAAEEVDGSISALFEQTEFQASPAMVLYNFATVLTLGILMAVFGVPMAANAANAVQHSPQHDIIYGLGRYVPHQIILYALFVAAPSAFFSSFALQSLLALGGSVGGLIVWGLGVAVFGLFTCCLPWTAMALAYGEVRGRVARERRAERVPDIDYDSEREKLRGLRQVRTTEKAGAQMYDPIAARRAAMRGED